MVMVVVRLGFVADSVSGAFDVPFGHLAFDQARAGPSAPVRVEAGGEDGECPGPEAV
jgi:hypothetical protein